MWSCLFYWTCRALKMCGFTARHVRSSCCASMCFSRGVSPKCDTVSLCFFLNSHHLLRFFQELIYFLLIFCEFNDSPVIFMNLLIFWWFFDELNEFLMFFFMNSLFFDDSLMKLCIFCRFLHELNDFLTSLWRIYWFLMIGWWWMYWFVGDFFHELNNFLKILYWICWLVNGERDWT